MSLTTSLRLSRERYTCQRWSCTQLHSSSSSKTISCIVILNASKSSNHYDWLIFSYSKFRGVFGVLGEIFLGSYVQIKLQVNDCLVLCFFNTYGKIRRKRIVIQDSVLLIKRCCIQKWSPSLKQHVIFKGFLCQIREGLDICTWF